MLAVRGLEEKRFLRLILRTCRQCFYGFWRVGISGNIDSFSKVFLDVFPLYMMPHMDSVARLSALFKRKLIFYRVKLQTKQWVSQNNA